MGQPAAKQGDHIEAQDTHIVIDGSTGTNVPLPHPFNGTINGNLSNNVKIMGQPAAAVGSTATNMPSHFPTPPGVSFQKPPLNRGTIQKGSATVKINGKPAARAGDIAVTCNDPADLPVGQVTTTGGTVFIG